MHLPSTVFALQILAAVILKSNERIFTALVFEAGFFLLLNAYNLCLFLTGYDLQIEVLQNGIVIYLLLLNAYFFNKIDGIQKFDWTVYKRVLSFGRPLVTTALLVMMLTGAARIIIERLIDIETVGVYGLYFRMAALVVLFYQVVNIVFFKKIYTSKPQQLDRWFQGFLFFIVLVSVAIFVMVPLLVLPFVAVIKATWSEHYALYGVLVFQMFFWIALALFENIIYRENLSRRCNVAFSVLITLMLLSLFVVDCFSDLTVVMLAGINVLTLSLACEWQMYLMLNKNIHFPKTKRLLRFCVLFFILYLFTI